MIEITRTEARHGAADHYAACGISVVHKVDGLSKLCRELVDRGFTGPAEVRNARGTLCLTVKAVELTATKTLRYAANSRGGGSSYSWAKYEPFTFSTDQEED